MEHDNRNPKGDQRQPGDNSGASTGTKVKMYPYNVNGVRLSTGTKMEANHAETWKNELNLVSTVKLGLDHHDFTGRETSNLVSS